MRRPGQATVPRITRCRATSTSTKMYPPRRHTHTILKVLRKLQASRGRHPPMLYHTATSISLSPPRVMLRMPAPTHRRLTTLLLMQAPMSHNDKLLTKDTIHMASHMARKHPLASINLQEVIRNRRLLLLYHPGLSSHCGAPHSMPRLAQHRPRHMTSLIANTQANCLMGEDLSRVLRSLHILPRRKCQSGHITLRMSIINSIIEDPVQIHRPRLWDHPRTLDQHHPDCNGTRRMHLCQVVLSTMSSPGVPDMSALRVTTLCKSWS